MSLVETLPTPETNTWCESGTVGDGGSSPGDIDPTGGDIAHGWPDSADPPARQRFNWLDHLVHRISRYFRQRGIPEYHSSETYPPGARIQYAGTAYQQVSGGNVSGVTPGTDVTKWLRWGHTDADIDGHVDSKLGTLSGAAPGGTLTSGNEAAHVAYGNVVRLPGSTIKMILFRLTFDQQDSYFATITLSGACAFASGADNVVVSIASSTTGAPRAYGSVSGNQTIDVGVLSPPASTVVVEVLVQGH